MVSEQTPDAIGTVLELGRVGRQWMAEARELSQRLTESQSALAAAEARAAAERARADAAVAALEFYASPATYQRPITDYGWGMHIPIEQDRGQRARAALAEQKSES